jgi:hypothetical protein
MLLASPQVVGYASELPRPGTYCTKTVMGRLVFGRNEPGLQHRHQTWQEAISRRT